jgi:hypothetical protein
VPNRITAGDNQLIASVFLFANFNNVESSRKLPNEFSNFRVNHNLKKSFDINVTYAYSTAEAIINVGSAFFLF